MNKCRKVALPTPSKPTCMLKCDALATHTVEFSAGSYSGRYCEAHADQTVADLNDAPKNAPWWAS